MKPDVSVIMYVKNGMPYFKRALQSVIHQTFYNIEILVIDGGSTDGTLEYTRQCQSADPRICILRSSQGSVGAQFNLGVEHAQGEYIGIVESDDYILPEMYEEELACAKECGCDVLRADNFVFFTNGDKEIRLQTRVSHKKGNYNRILCVGREPENVLIGGSFWTGIYRREFLVEKNIRMNETSGAAYQDFGFLFLTGALAESTYIIPRAFYCYRKDNPQSSCNQPARLDMPVQEYRFLEKELKKRGIWEQYKEYFFLWKIRNERWFYFNLDEAMKERYVHVLYEDLKEMTKNSFSCALLNNKERTFLEIANRGEEELCEYLRQKVKGWTESAEKIETQNADIIYLFGAGNIGRIFYYFLQNNQSRENIRNGVTAAYVDNSPELWGVELDGVPVVSPKEAFETKDAFFIVCSENYADEIYIQIKAAGVPDCNIAVCDDMDSCIRLAMGRKA